MTVYDKIISKNPKRRRVSEANLFIIAILGGSLVEYLTMLIVRHKTKHKKFMLGLPIIILVQAALIFVLWQQGFFSLQPQFSF